MAISTLVIIEANLKLKQRGGGRTKAEIYVHWVIFMKLLIWLLGKKNWHYFIHNWADPNTICVSCLLTIADISIAGYKPLFRIQMVNNAGGLVEYDPMSIMHFHDRAYSLNGQATITALVNSLNNVLRCFLRH